MGSGYPRNNVQAAITALKRGDAASGLANLTHCRPVDFGPPVGSPDIGGWVPVRGLAVVLGVEVKVNDRQSPEQIVCEHVYRSAGAVYVLARDVEQALAEIEAAVEGLRMRACP